MSARSRRQLPLWGSEGQGADAGFAVRVVARARRLTVRVYPGGRVAVTVPPGTSPLAVERFVSRHRAWIDARVGEARLTRGPAALPEVVRFAALDEDWRVTYLEAGRPAFSVRYPGHLEVAAPAADPAAARLVLRRWLAEQGDRRLAPWLRRVAGARGFDFERAQVRRQRTRWGSCSRSGTISLNVCLLFQPADVVEYLFLHELCHTRHMNHSARFWSLVAAHEPRYRDLDRQLTRGWQHVPGWVYD